MPKYIKLKEERLIENYLREYEYQRPDSKVIKVFRDSSGRFVSRKHAEAMLSMKSRDEMLKQEAEAEYRRMVYGSARRAPAEPAAAPEAAEEAAPAEEPAAAEEAAARAPERQRTVIVRKRILPDLEVIDTRSKLFYGHIAEYLRAVDNPDRGAPEEAEERKRVIALASEVKSSIQSIDYENINSIQKVESLNVIEGIAGALIAKKFEAAEKMIEHLEENLGIEIPDIKRIVLARKITDSDVGIQGGAPATEPQEGAAGKTMGEYSHAINFWVRGNKKKGEGIKVSVAAKAWGEFGDPRVKEEAISKLKAELEKLFTRNRKIFGNTTAETLWVDVSQSSEVWMADPLTGMVAIQGSGWNEVPYREDLFMKSLSSVEMRRSKYA